MAKGLPKTNAARALDALGISYELRAYDVDEQDLSAETVAGKVGLPPGQVWKTLCVRGDRHGVALAVLPGDHELDRKALAKCAQERSVTPVSVRELPGLTGYVRGGVTALALRKPYPVFVDESVTRLDVISVSAGQRGLQLLIAPADYLRATRATLAPIARPKKG